MTFSSISLTHVAFWKARATFVYRPSDNKSRIVVLLGLPHPVLGLAEAFLLLSELSPPSVRLSDASPTFPHSPQISPIRGVHSLKRYSLLCLPLLHNPHVTVRPLPLSLEEGRCPGVAAQELEARSVAVRLKARLIRVAIMWSPGSVSLDSATAHAYWSANSLPATPRLPGTQLMEMVLPWSLSVWASSMISRAIS